MIAWLKHRLRAWVLTDQDRQLLTLRADQRAVFECLLNPDRWQPDAPLTQSEAEAWGAALRAPVGRKIDIAMVNMAQQQAQAAVHAEAGSIQRMAGFAAGFRASWVIAKALSTTAGADAGNNEDTTGTAADTLAHLNP